MAYSLTAPLPGAGEQYGKYRLVEKIAVGGMAEVFKAVSTSIGGFEKEVAVKRILPHLSTDAEFVSLFIDEAKLTVTLNHGNVVQVFDFGRIENNYYIAMEFVDGRDMTQVLIKRSRQRKLVPLEAALYIVSEGLRGLEYAHSRKGRDGRDLGCVHRDVSPHNVLVSYDGEVKITDFGIAKARTKVSLTRPGVVLGKFAYMSPEQARGTNVDARSDVYSAGITLYETLTGRRLFYSDDPAVVLAKVRDPKVPPPSRYNQTLTPSVDQMVLKALARDPKDRFQSAREFATALEQELRNIAPGFNDSHLSFFMKELFEDEVGAARFAMAAPAPAERATERAMPSQDLPTRGFNPKRFGDAGLDKLAKNVLRDPNLWTLVEFGDRLIFLKRFEDAQRVLRVAGMKFAQNGLLVQAVAIYVRIKKLQDWNAELALEVEALREMPGAENPELIRRLKDLGRDDVGLLLREVLNQQGPSESAEIVSSPLFSFLDSAEFANLVQLLELRECKPGEVIMKEGGKGDSLMIIARGRVVVYCENFHGDKVYLSSLSDGDCFGEFSFFTGEARAATAESSENTLLFEIRDRDFDTILDRFPSLTQALLRFYKSRVVSTLLAKSEVFGGLKPEDRKKLLDQLRLEHRGAGEVILREGDRSDGFYLIKSGEVEVYSERKGYVFLNKLRSGEFFGEMSALTGQPRSASVRALGPCELLTMSGDDLLGLLNAHPGVNEVLHAHIVRREAETALRITANGQLI